MLKISSERILERLNDHARQAVARFEADLVRRALDHSSGDRTRAAKLLQIPKRTLADKCIRYAL
jgi:sigma-54-specific transcriptional regulator